MRINNITRNNYQTYRGQVNTPAKNANTTQNNFAQNPPMQKSDPLKRIPTSAYIYSGAALGLLVGGVIIHHQLKVNSKKLKQVVEKSPINNLEQNIQQEITEVENKEILKPKVEEKILNDTKPINTNLISDTFEKLEKNPEELKKSFNIDNSQRQEFFKDFDTALESKDTNAENNVFSYLTNPNNSREAQDLIYSHMENDYKPTFDSLVDTLHNSDAGRTYIPTLRVMAKRGNEKDIKEIQTIIQTPNTASMIYTNIAVSYTKLPKERFDKDIIPIFDGLYADKKVALLQVFETHKSKEYVPLLDSMRGIQGYESFIYPQIDHAKQSCQG